MPDKTVWYTDDAHKGLRLCVTKTGVKTLYVNKWDPTANKVRSVKLGQWSPKVTHCKWAKGQLGVVAHDIASGSAQTRDEVRAREVIEQANALPTFAEALEQYINHRATERASGKDQMMETTACDYRNSFKNHLTRWADVHVNELPILQINQHLNGLQLKHPHAAQHASTLAGAVVRFINRLCALALPIPSLLDNTKVRSRVENGKLDMSVPWSDRWTEIAAIKNEHIRLCWEANWYTGFRGRSFRSLRWDDVDLSSGAVTFERSKKVKGRTIVLADDVAAMFERLQEIRYGDCDWAFPSRVMRRETRGHLDLLDRLPQTNPGEAKRKESHLRRSAEDTWDDEQAKFDAKLKVAVRDLKIASDNTHGQYD